MTQEERISVDVCYAMADRQEVVTVTLPAGSTLGQALEASGLLTKYPDIDVKKNKFGIWNKLAKLDAALRARDRVEIYRPLIADPKEVRKQRAAEGKVMKKGAGEGEGGEA
jgi:putative ubiquitin-RnfH superfamily antitoxin RatB of RatAB toxin-antitoxin module